MRAAHLPRTDQPSNAMLTRLHKGCQTRSGQRTGEARNRGTARSARLCCLTHSELRASVPRHCGWNLSRQAVPERCNLAAPECPASTCAGRGAAQHPLAVATQTFAPYRRILSAWWRRSRLDASWQPDSVAFMCGPNQQCFSSAQQRVTDSSTPVARPACNAFQKFLKLDQTRANHE